MNRDCLIAVVTCLLVALPKAQGHSIGGTNGTLNLPEVRGNRFLYFGFGSNMLAKRIHIQNPTAVRVGPGLLPDYRLDFAFESARWGGAVATIVPTQGDHAWGTLWKIDLTNLPDIDNQEGVHEGIYESRTVYVKPRGESDPVPARAYLLTKQPDTNLYKLSKDSVPASRQPSKTYLQCLVQGAIESSVPEDYVRRLRGIKHNGHVASDLEQKLELQNVAL
ncbi:gamma-glutamylcyclotransferase [Drosophila takahashii]|uniref:gamma-glutamylcyclotransferase n=1 Tax=Drosophila takahashii TaxID=29030 RepID=UPI001CF8D64D|nr:gamma-glutamylcyclotransferase [Drosophila takahashii]